jgi:hypothetical protein
MMVIVDGVDDLFLAVFENFPNGTSDNVTPGKSGYLQTLAFALQMDRLGILDLKYLVKGIVNVVQIEKIKVFALLLGLKGEKGRGQNIGYLYAC